MRNLFLPSMRTIFIWALAAALALTSGLFAFAEAMRGRAPQTVLAVNHGDKLAALIAWDRIIAAQPERIVEASTGRIARALLSAEPLNARALQLLASAAQGRGDGAALRLATLAQDVSRRDLLNQLFLVQFYVDRGDIAGALRHYDIALRTKPESARLLFPILKQAMDAPEIQAGLVPYIRSGARWTNGFLFGAMDMPGGPRAVAQMILAASAGGGLSPVGRMLAPPLLDRLVASGDFGQAVTYLAQLTGGSAAIVSDPRLTSQTTNAIYGPFSWMPIATSGGGASFLPPNGAREVSVRISASVSSAAAPPVLRRVVALPPGAYLLEDHRRASSPRGAGTSRWAIACIQGAGEGTTPLWQDAPVEAQSGVHRATGLVIPVSCKWQEITLSLQASDLTPDIDFDIEGFNLSLVDDPAFRIGSSSAGALRQ